MPNGGSAKIKSNFFSSQAFLRNKILFSNSRKNSPAISVSPNLKGYKMSGGPGRTHTKMGSSLI